MVTRDAHLCCSAGEGESPTGAPPLAEEGRTGLEDAVGCNPLVRSSEGRWDMSLGLQVRTWGDWYSISFSSEKKVSGLSYSRHCAMKKLLLRVRGGSVGTGVNKTSNAEQHVPRCWFRWGRFRQEDTHQRRGSGSRQSVNFDGFDQPTKRPPRAREVILEGLMGHVPRNPILLDEKMFSQNLRSARGRAAIFHRSHNAPRSVRLGLAEAVSLLQLTPESDGRVPKCVSRSVRGKGSFSGYSF